MWDKILSALGLKTDEYRTGSELVSDALSVFSDIKEDLEDGIDLLTRETEVAVAKLDEERTKFEQFEADTYAANDLRQADIDRADRAVEKLMEIIG